MSAMAVDLNKLWKRIRTGTNEVESVRTLAKILSSNDGWTIILDLDLRERNCVLRS